MSRPKFYTPGEVAVHNTIDDLWVSFLGKVYDLTSLCENYKGDVMLKPIIAAGGTDISHWFDAKTRDIRMHIDPVTGCRFPFTPMGRFIHIPPREPSSKWCNDFGRPWWKDESRSIGVLTNKTRIVNIINTLTSQEQEVEVCSEENIYEILDRYLRYNAHAASYTWKYDGEVLDMEKTLTENGIEDDDEQFAELSMRDDSFRQAIHLYFNDDLTEA